MRHYKLLFCDLDGTLIKTRSGKTFPKGVWDMELRLEVFEAIKRFNPDFVGIVSNQGGIQAGYVRQTYFNHKIDYVEAALEDYLDIFGMVCYRYCDNEYPSNPYRKPNTRMLEELYKVFGGPYIGKPLAKSECLMICDASGKEGQYSDTDLKTAQNFGIDYMDVEEFVAIYGEPMNKLNKEQSNERTI